MRLKIRVIWNKSGRLYENALSQWGWNLSRTRNCYCSTSKNGRMTKETIEKRMSSAVVVWFFFYATRNWNTSRIILKNAKCWGNRQIICGIVIKLKALNFQLFFFCQLSCNAWLTWLAGGIFSFLLSSFMAFAGWLLFGKPLLSSACGKLENQSLLLQHLGQNLVAALL